MIGRRPSCGALGDGEVDSYVGLGESQILDVRIPPEVSVSLGLRRTIAIVSKSLLNIFFDLLNNMELVPKV